MLGIELNMINSALIVFGFSVFVILLDEWVIKAWRTKHWEKLAAAGDKEKLELLRIAKSAVAVDE